MLKISEHFYSIQGEGPLSGIPSYLIRTTGCQLNCINCDSKFSWFEGEDLNDIIDKINIPKQCEHVIITGGEPTIHFHKEEFKLLLSKLSDKFIEVETTALPLDVSMMKYTTIIKMLSDFDAMTGRELNYRVSPKLELGSNIAAYRYHSITKNDIFKYYRIDDRSEHLNFVYKIVHSKENEEIIKEFLDGYIENDYFRKYKLFIMPLTPEEIGYKQKFRDKYRSNCEDTIEFCKEYGLRYTPRVHIDVYGLKRGV